MPSRTDWLLLLIGAQGGDYQLDQVRVMKGLFLLSRDGGPLEGQYQFSAYDYGPFDSRVYRDLDELQAQGLVAVSHAGIGRRRNYDLTHSGRVRYVDLQGQMTHAALAEVAAVKSSVTTNTFEELLADIYGRFPEYATRSVAQIKNRASAS